MEWAVVRAGHAVNPSLGARVAPSRRNTVRREQPPAPPAAACPPLRRTCCKMPVLPVLPVLPVVTPTAAFASSLYLEARARMTVAAEDQSAGHAMNPSLGLALRHPWRNTVRRTDLPPQPSNQPCHRPRQQLSRASASRVRMRESWRDFRLPLRGYAWPRVDGRTSDRSTSRVAVRSRSRADRGGQRDPG